MAIADKPVVLANNIWLNAAVTPDNEDTDFEGYRLSDGNRGSVWKSTASGTQKIDLIVPDDDVIEVDAFVLDKSWQMSGATLRVKAAANAAFTLSVVTVVTVAADTLDSSKEKLFVFDTPVTKKYWRIEIEDATDVPYIFNAGVFPIIELLNDPSPPFDPYEQTKSDEFFEADDGNRQKRRRLEKRVVQAAWDIVDDPLYQQLRAVHSQADGNPVWWWFRPGSETTYGVYGYITSPNKYPFIQAQREGELVIEEM